MPIVNEGMSGLRRFAVFSFVEDEEFRSKTSNGAKAFPNSPLTSALEAATRLQHTELFHMKRLRSIEAHVPYPHVDVTFVSSFENVSEVKEIIHEDDCVNHHNTSIRLQKGVYEELQLVDPKRDMIQTPIDASEHSELIREAEDEKHLRGYLLIAYKTMEDMYSRYFAASWKTWTGVRYICMQLPRQLGLRRISFYRQISRTSDFQYILVMEISNLLLYAPQTLNLMDKIKLRLCGHVGIFRESEFKLDHATAASLNMETDYIEPHRILQSRKASVGTIQETEDLMSFEPPTSERRPWKGVIGKKESVVAETPKVSITEKREIISDLTKKLSQAAELKSRKESAPTVLPSKESSSSVSTPLKKAEGKPPLPPARKSGIPVVLSSATTTPPTPRRDSSRRSTLSSTSTEPPQDQPVKEVKEVRETAITLEKPEKEKEPFVFKPQARFVGKGRIYQGEPSSIPSPIRPLFASGTQPLISSLPIVSIADATQKNSEQKKSYPYMPSRYQEYVANRRYSDVINLSKPRHNVVNDLPSSEPKGPPPQYQSIFDRKQNDSTRQFGDFSTLVASLSTTAPLYNSPCFTRSEWKEGSSAYRDTSRGDSGMGNLAESLTMAASELKPLNNSSESNIAKPVQFSLKPPSLEEVLGRGHPAEFALVASQPFSSISDEFIGRRNSEAESELRSNGREPYGGDFRHRRSIGGVFDAETLMQIEMLAQQRSSGSDRLARLGGSKSFAGPSPRRRFLPVAPDDGAGPRGPKKKSKHRRSKSPKGYSSPSPNPTPSPSSFGRYNFN